MLRQTLTSFVVMLLLCQLGLAQDSEGEARAAAKPQRAYVPRASQQSTTSPRQGPYQLVQKKVTPPTAAPAATPSVDLDVLIGCVVFDEQGELRVEKEGAEPEVNRAGTIGANLAIKLNEDRGTLPKGVTPGTAGANFLLKGLAGEEKLQSLEQFRLRMSTDGEEAHFQNGQRVPRITGSAVRNGGLTNTISLENMGVLIGGTAQITKTGKIALTIELERSGFGPEEEGTPVAVSEGKTSRTPRLDTITIKTQTSVADGESVVLSSLVRAAGPKVTEAFVVVTATVVKP